MIAKGAARPYLVEVAGVAGSGKSTLAKALLAGDGYVQGEFIHTRSPVHLAYVARSIPRLLPILIAGGMRKPRVSWREFKLMAYVTEWRRFLCNRQRYRNRTVVLDQGPIYALVRLKALDSGIANTRSFHRWWNEMMRSWSDALDDLIWLDAPDHLLLQRIDGRQQAHVVKGERADVSLRFITRYRSMFEDAIRTLEDLGGPPVIRFNTARDAPDRIAAVVNSAVSSRDRSSK